MNHNLAQRIRDCTTLPTLPAIALQVLDLAQRDDSEVAEISRVISSDPALSGKILRTVNSSFYGRSQTVATISHALVILGLQSVKTLVLGFSLAASLKSKNKSKSGTFDHGGYWKRSIYAATAARTIASRFARVQAEECFLAGLLMDIGMLVLDRVMGEEYAVLVEKAPTHAALSAVEEASFAGTHAEVSALLAEDWKLPPVLAVPMGHHHDPESVSDEALRQLSQVVHLAGRCADVYTDENASGAIKDVREICKRWHRMPEPDCDLLLGEIGRKTAEVAPLFEVQVGSENFDAILRKANERLVELTLSTQREAAQLLAEANNLKQTASVLQVQNQKLREKATTDGLTGLANRVSFDLFFNERFNATAAEGTALSLMIIDVDHFKKINDTYGHQAGDAVLKTVAQILAGRARRTDLAARYGGEEFAMVLPETSRVQAAALAEAIRRALTARPVSIENAQIPITACIGVATFDASSVFKEPGRLLKAADLAVYAAKSAGRNCVRVFSFKPAA